MNKITHMIDKEGNVVIEAMWDVNTYVAVLVPHIIGDKYHIKKSWIDTFGLDDSKGKKENIISAITTQKGKHNEAPLVVEEDE